MIHKMSLLFLIVYKSMSIVVIFDWKMFDTNIKEEKSNVTIKNV